MSRVAKAGFKSEFVRSALLPDWWESDCASDPTLLPEVEIRIARFLGVSVSQLRGAEQPLLVPEYPRAKLRKVKNIDADRLGPTIHAALRIAGAVIRCLREPERPVVLPPSNPNDWAEAMFRSRVPINLDGQVRDLWRRGIAIVHVDVLPSPRFQAVAAVIGGKPIIVLAYRGDEPPRLAFHLAHEVGHHVLGHCGENEPVVDDEEEVSDSSAIEREADAYGVGFVTAGRTVPALKGRSPKELARQASSIARQTGIDPGAVLWAWTVQERQYQLGTLALRAAYRATGARRVLRDHFDRNVDLDLASDTDRALLRCVFADPDRDAPAD